MDAIAAVAARARFFYDAGASQPAILKKKRNWKWRLGLDWIFAFLNLVFGWLLCFSVVFLIFYLGVWMVFCLFFNSGVLGWSWQWGISGVTTTNQNEQRCILALARLYLTWVCGVFLHGIGMGWDGGFYANLLFLLGNERCFSGEKSSVSLFREGGVWLYCFFF
jgi:hypothetical protein